MSAQTYRQCYLNTLRGEPTDRLPLVEAAKFNMVRHQPDWQAHLGPDGDPLAVFGFDNVAAPLGYESAPIDFYAVPRFPETPVASDDGYRRTIDGRYGRIRKAMPPTPGSPTVRVFEGHTVETAADWDEVKQRFQLSTEGRFPANWQAWAEQSKTAGHPIVVEARDPAATIANLLGQEGETGLFVGLQERPQLVREMIEHLAQLNRVCLEKALRETQPDMLMIGSDLVPLIGPLVVRESFLDAYADSIALAREHGVDLICLQGRGDLRPLVEMFREAGVNGLKYIMEAGAHDTLGPLLDRWGDDLFYLGAIDGRVLREAPPRIEAEVDHKLALARQYRMIPCLHVTHLLPDVPYANYRHYAEYLRQRITGDPRRLPSAS